jgi:hypothetical protein
LASIPSLLQVGFLVFFLPFFFFLWTFPSRFRFGCDAHLNLLGAVGNTAEEIAGKIGSWIAQGEAWLTVFSFCVFFFLF